MRKTACSRTLEALRSGPRTGREERHLFACPACRARVRVMEVWRNLSHPAEAEVLGPAEESFVRRVVAAIREDRRRRRRNRARLAVAAALLFFFFAGAGQRVSARAAAGAEDAYAQLVAPPPVMSDLLPLSLD